MTLKFSANLSTMFLNWPLQERFTKAKEVGFTSVEIQDPYCVPPGVLKHKMENMSCDLINLYGGSNKFGSASMPLHEMEFHNATQAVIPYHHALNFKKLHILSGLKVENFTKEDQIQTFVGSLNSLVEGDFLENMGVIGLIEPICSSVCTNYFLNSFDTAVEVLRQVNSDQIKLLLDVYHLHKITGDVVKNLERYYPYAGHIQISQEPGRKEPFCAGGIIDYSYVFDFLRKKNHSDFIGLEYYPSDSTAKGFEWMKKYA